MQLKRTCLALVREETLDALGRPPHSDHSRDAQREAQPQKHDPLVATSGVEAS
jgi:hypothetical protein